MASITTFKIHKIDMFKSWSPSGLGNVKLADVIYAIILASVIISDICIKYNKDNVAN
jgi:hypothetical protein